MPIWIKLLTIKHREERGVLRTYFPGDWIKVGKTDALRWLADGTAETAQQQLTRLMPGCGVVTIGQGNLPDEIDSVQAAPSVPFARTLIWTTTLELKYQLVPVGFRLLDKWDMAVPLFDYTTLACHVGSDQEREQTQAVIRDLRVLLYDTRLIFVKKHSAGVEVISRWTEEAGERRLAFLRALYQVKPLVCALPITWVGKDVGR